MRKKRKRGEPITENRRILHIGNAWYLNVPPEFVEAHGLKHRDKVPITCNHLLKVIPHSEV
jgi:hypothetical protein